MIPWPHQQYGRAAITAAIASGARNICLTSPTGGGKTWMIFDTIQNTQGNISLYTDRRMLLAQIADGLDKAGIEYGIRASGHEPALLRRIQLSMMQTEGSQVLKSENRTVHPANLIFIDEAHKMAAGSMVALDQEHVMLKPDRVKIGMTATPLGIGHFYDTLIIAGRNSSLRKCGALLPAYHYGPDEPDTKWIGRVAVDGGECGITSDKRRQYAHMVFGRVLEFIPIYNPHGLPGILFAPGVEQSKWFAQELTKHGYPSAHLDGNEIWVDGCEMDANDANRQMLAERSKSGDLRYICNRFVLREGVNWPWLYHGIFATVFGSLTAYIQAGGRMLRYDPSLPGHVVIQDHGGNWHRHGSLNSDREWDLGYDDRIVQGMRKERLQSKTEPEPIVCPVCHACRLSGSECPRCGYRHTGRIRSVLQKDGSLREMKGDIYRAPRRLERSTKIEKEWVSRIRAIRRSNKPSVMDMSFSQAEVAFARDHKWQYPPRNLPEMPLKLADWFRPIQMVPEERLSKSVPKHDSTHEPASEPPFMKGKT